MQRRRINSAGVDARVRDLERRQLGKTAREAALGWAMSVVDLTTLEGADTPGRVRDLCSKALHPCSSMPDLPRPAAVCVYPAFVKQAKAHLAGSDVKVACVATAFPSGQYHLATRLGEVEAVVEDGVDEVDMVINRGAFLSGDHQRVGDEIRAVKQAAGPAHLKVILETGELATYDNVRRASDIAIQAGADFIKTSTGKIKPAATLGVTLVMLQAIRAHHLETGQRLGMKPAGGIASGDDAIKFFCLVKETLGEAWLDKSLFRIGASSLVDKLIAEIAALRVDGQES